LPRAGAISIVGMTLATWCIEIVKANQAFVEQYLQLADKKASIPSSQTQGGNSASSGCLGALLVSITLLLGASSFT
jgi:hypothetical protein